MEDKNLLLLGFINKAAEYLDNNMGNDRNSSGLSASARQKLAAQLSAFSNDKRSAALLENGAAIFDSYMRNEKPSLADEFSQMLDVDLDTDAKQDFDDLLSFYGLSKDLFKSDVQVKEPAHQSKPDDEGFRSIAAVIGDNANREEEAGFELNDEETQLLQMISDNVEINENRTLNSRDIPGSGSRTLDSLFKEVNNPESVRKNDLPNVNVFNQIIDDPLDSAINDIDQGESKVDGVVLNPTSAYLKDPAEQEIVLQDNSGGHKVGRDDIVDLVRNIQADSDVHYANTDFSVPEEEVTAAYQQSREERNASYISSLIDDLKEQFIKEEEKRKKDEERIKETYARIHKSYPYLSGNFIETVYSMKDALSSEYPFDVNIIVLHRSGFSDVESLRQFVEIALSHDFAINADEEKLIVDVFKEYVNSDGKILTSIFEVANQAALLNGEYDGYRVMLADEYEM